MSAKSAKKSAKRKKQPAPPIVPAERQRILSDESILFVYTEQDLLIHDKTCEVVKEIPVEDLKSSDIYLTERKQCPKCALTAYLRIRSDDRKSYRTYEELYKRMNVTPEQLREIYIEHNMTSSVRYNAVRLNHQEDSWLLVPIGKDGTVRLMHNNYRVNADGSRFFYGGFHEQNLGAGRHNLRRALDTIENYTFEKHLAAQQAEATPAEPTVEVQKKASLWGRIAAWLKRTFIRRGK